MQNESIASFLVIFYILMPLVVEMYYCVKLKESV